MKKIFLSSFSGLGLLFVLIFVFGKILSANATSYNNPIVDYNKPPTTYNDPIVNYDNSTTYSETRGSSTGTTIWLSSTTTGSLNTPNTDWSVSSSSPASIQTTWTSSTTPGFNGTQSNTEQSGVIETTKTQTNQIQVSTQALVSEVVAKIQNTTNIFGVIHTAVENTKTELLRIVDQIIKKITLANATTTLTNIEPVRKEIVAKIDMALTSTSSINQKVIDKLKVEINDELKKIGGSSTTTQNNYSEDITKTLETLSLTVNRQEKILKSQEGDLLYKDSNKDGISDYDSVYVYNIDPIKPSPTTVYEGRKITAGEKILLGFDPTKTTLVKIIPEEPGVSLVSETTAYNIQEVKLTTENQVSIKGLALPNSFITIYVYSTPIIVTVKTNALGEWQYTLNQELDNGEHLVYLATVNNTGKILAKSSSYTFTKTAEAAALGSLPPIKISSDNTKPGILSGKNIFTIIGSIVIMIFLALLIIGRSSRKNKII